MAFSVKAITPTHGLYTAETDWWWSNVSDDGEREGFGYDVVEAWHSRRLEAARASYEDALNRLWAGNAGGAATCITGLGWLVKDGQRPAMLLLLPLAAFIVGLLSLGFGAYLSLRSDAQVLRDLENAQSVLDVKVRHIMRPSDEAGLSYSNPRTIAALVAAGCFLFGIFLGFIVGIVIAWRALAETPC